MEDKLLTVAKARKLAGVSVASIRRWTDSGKIKSKCQIQPTFYQSYSMR